MATPFKCPICEGSGNVPFWFYNSPTAKPAWDGQQPSMIDCRACKSRGLVWDYSPEEYPDDTNTTFGISNDIVSSAIQAFAPILSAIIAKTMAPSEPDPIPPTSTVPNNANNQTPEAAQSGQSQSA